MLATLWAAEIPLTAADVQERLGGGLAYSTVVTILSRLHAKGSLEREQQGRAYGYRPVADEPGLAARRMRQVLEGEQDRLRVLARFVADLSPEDERMVRELLRERRGGPGGAGRA